MTDNINAPAHYTAQKIESIIIVQFMPFMIGNAFKYVWRYKLKNGCEDLKKAEYFIKRQLRIYPENKQVGLLRFPQNYDLQAYLLNCIAPIEDCDFSKTEKKILQNLCWYCCTGNSEKLEKAQKHLNKLIRKWEGKHG